MIRAIFTTKAQSASFSSRVFLRSGRLQTSSYSLQWAFAQARAFSNSSWS